MKNILWLLFLVLGLTATKASAQMPTAQQIKWDANKEVELSMDVDSVWEIFQRPELLKRASNGYVTSVEITDPKFPVSRKITFANGASRMENVVQNERQNKLMVIEFANASLPRGIKSAEIAIFIRLQDPTTKILWKAKATGDSEAKKILIEQLTAEFESYVAGFNKMSRKVIPAVKMN
ncbi:hypothetical protein LPB86_10030 [Pedobacter sp. MC2016-14]|uniref:hypothetical protein n=1 Tax=Pedobacter sp. MC2016-14 TaxID=2897327 RepID=UPI001E4F9A80|nr:hypothetical protein [Pedobacter sp. MC2016-14]MCD0488570.1 hypothetical protein [Pedobacter sp. MC2016-14]